MTKISVREKLLKLEKNCSTKDFSRIYTQFTSNENTESNLSEEYVSNGGPATFNTDFDSTNLSNSIHLLPCSIDYNGEASVEKFFHKYISSTKNSNSEIEYTGTFRGYPLKGGVASCPDGFTFALMRETQTNSQESRMMKECERFEKFICWNVSDTPTSRDPLFKALKWVDIASIIHED